MSNLFFEGLSNSGKDDLFMYEGSGTPVDLTASFDTGNGGVVDGYENELGSMGVDPGPTLAGAGNDVFFAGNDDGLRTLFVYNETTGAVSALQPGKAYGSGVIPQDVIAFGAKVFFVGVNAAGKYVLWKSNGTSAGTKEIAGSPDDLGDMTLLGSTLYFRDNKHLESYNTQTGEFASIANSVGLDPQGMLISSISTIYGSVKNVFMAGTDGAGEQNIFMLKGAKLLEFKSNVYSGAMDPYDLTDLFLYSSMATIRLGYFSGVDNSSGDRGLYTVYWGAPRDQAIEVAASSFGGSSNLDPFDLTAISGEAETAQPGELYFTGNDQYSSGRGLFVYDTGSKTVTEVIHSNQLDLTDGYKADWGAANVPTLGVYDGHLYFGASNPNVTGAASVNQLYEYSGSGSTATLVSVDDQRNIFGGQPANLIVP